MVKCPFCNNGEWVFDRMEERRQPNQLYGIIETYQEPMYKCTNPTCPTKYSGIKKEDYETEKERQESEAKK